MRTVLISLFMGIVLGGLVFGADGPIDQGSVLLDGGFDFSATGGDIVGNETMTVVRFQPMMGYFVAPGFMLGGQFSLEHASQSGESATLFGVGPIIGYYLNPDPDRIKGSIYPYIRAQLAYSTISSGNDYDISTLEVGGGVGMLFMMSGTIGFDFGIRFSYINESYNTDWYDDSESGYNILVGGGIAAFIY